MSAEEDAESQEAPARRRPGTLRWKFNGGRGSMVDSEGTVVGYWNPPSERQVEAVAIEAAADAILGRYPGAANELLRIARAVRRGETL